MGTTPVDWAYIICRLQRSGMTLKQQAKELEISRRQIHRYRDGENEPSYSIGSRLLSLYQTVYPST